MTRAEKRMRTMAPELHEALIEAHELLSVIWEKAALPSATRTVILHLEDILAKATGDAP